MNLAIFIVILMCISGFVASDYQSDALYQMKVQLKAAPNQLTDWNENIVTPCIWNSVTCDGNNVIKVTLPSFGFTGTLSPSIGQLKFLQVLSLQDNYITGIIPPEFGNLSSLTSLNMKNNNLTGEIPDTLGKLSKLQILDLSQNELIGNIPNSLSDISSLNDISLESNNLTGTIPSQLYQAASYNFSGNNLNCNNNLSQPCESSSSNHGGSKKSKTGAIIGSIIGSITFISLLILFIIWKNKRNRNLIFYDVPGEDYRKLGFGQLKRFSYRELQLATEDFNERNILGQGGFGKVYKGVLLDDKKTRIAVKRLTDFENPGGETAFLREVEMISIAVHKNLLRLVGFCVSGKEKLLVYPFMENLSVAYRLREFKPPQEPLDWPTRFKISLGAARGLEYLHEHCNPKIIHRDVKAANVLLNTDLEAVVGDFGLAKMVDVRRTSVTTKVRGTMGHIAPEYLSTGKSSDKTDVFGYGILLLEIVTGQRAIEYLRLEEEDDVLLLDHVRGTMGHIALEYLSTGKSIDKTDVFGYGILLLEIVTGQRAIEYLRLEEEDDVLLLDHVKKLLKEGRFDAIIDRNLKNNYEIHEVEKIIKIALLCTQPVPEERPAMSEVVRMLEGEGLGLRWQEWQLAEVSRRQRYDVMQRRLEFGEGSIGNLQDIELSGGR